MYDRSPDRKWNSVYEQIDTGGTGIKINGHHAYRPRQPILHLQVTHGRSNKQTVSQTGEALKVCSSHFVDSAKSYNLCDFIIHWVKTLKGIWGALAVLLKVVKIFF